VTNHPEHDPDIQHIPFFAISKDFFGSLWSTYYKRVMALDAFSKVMIPLQHRIYYVVLSLARFNLYANSYAYLFGPKPKHDSFWRFELAGVAFYWAYFGAMLHSLPSWKLRMGYLLISHMVSSPVHVQVGRTQRYALIPDRAVSFRMLYRGSRASRVLPLETTANHHGRRLPS